MAADALKTLHTTLLDTLEGYEAAEREAEDPALKLLFREMIDLRAKITRKSMRRLQLPANISLTNNRSWRRCTRLLLTSDRL